MNSAEYFEQEYQRQMYKRIGCLPVLLLCVVLSFVGCKTIRESEIVEIHDTVTTHRIDTVRVYQIKTVHDTIRETSNHVLTLNEKGDTIREYHYFHEKEKVIEKDSTDKYVSLIDSLRQSLNTSHEKEKVVEKKDWWAEWKWKLFTFALLIAVILLAIKFIFPKWKQKYKNKSNI